MELLCSLFRSPWADKREEEENTPNVYFYKRRLARTKENKQPERKGRKNMGMSSISREMSDITPYPIKKRFSTRSRIFLSKNNNMKTKTKRRRSLNKKQRKRERKQQSDKGNKNTEHTIKPRETRKDQRDQQAAR